MSSLFLVSVESWTDEHNLHQVKHSSASLLHYLKGLKQNNSALVDFTETLLLIFKQYQKKDRWDRSMGVFVCGQDMI